MIFLDILTGACALGMLCMAVMSIWVVTDDWRARRRLMRDLHRNRANIDRAYKRDLR
jgi:hypothetical protein